jgi:hypothetical protein
MTNTIGSTQDPGLQPAAAAARQSDQGAEEARRALDRDQAEGRDAVQATQDTAASSTTDDPTKGTGVNEIA